MTTTLKQTSALILYLSLHGTTQKAVDALAHGLNESKVTTEICNLNRLKDQGKREAFYLSLPTYDLIVIASPTYFHHAPPVFTEFIQALPVARPNQAAAILTTFGGVSSGVIQFDLAKTLDEKSYRLIGGIKVLTEHSLTFKEETPFYKGHPNERDLSIVRDFGKKIAARLMEQDIHHYSPMAFKDKPGLLNFIDDHINKLEHFKWAMPPIRVDKNKCTACGKCVPHCPTNNIAIEKRAMHGNTCTYCYGCIKHCPSGAVTAFLKPALPTVMLLAKVFSKYEDQVTGPVV